MLGIRGLVVSWLIVDGQIGVRDQRSGVGD